MAIDMCTHPMGNSLHVGPAETATSESGTRELINSVASPQQWLT